LDGLEQDGFIWSFRQTRLHVFAGQQAACRRSSTQSPWPAELRREV